MGKLLVVVFSGILVLQGCSFSSIHRKKEKEVLSSLQTDIWGEGPEHVVFDKDSRTYKIISHSFAAMAQRELEGSYHWLNYESWNHFLEARILELFKNTDERITISNLGDGYRVKKLSPKREILFIAVDGELVFDIVNGYVNKLNE